jgi:predicted transcriptional regulator of viral defense system
MQYIKLKESLKDFTVFSLRDIKAIDSNFHRRRLNEWQDKNYIRKLIRGHYIFTDIQINENSLFEIANKIYSPSYISFEMALSYYNLIPESVYCITSASTRKTYKFQTSVGQFSYRTVKPALFFGYNLVSYSNRRFKIASVEKAILDYFYINPNIRNDGDFASLRVNRDSFTEQIDMERLNEFLERFAQKTLTKRINSFLEFIKNA